MGVGAHRGTPLGVSTLPVAKRGNHEMRLRERGLLFITRKRSLKPRHTMNVEPYKKKARAVKDAPMVVESGGDVPGIYFTPELYARVATFSEAVVRPGHVGASDVKNMCLAVGPMPSRIIKHVYLENNMGYLEKVNQTFTHRSSAEWARECHLAWMSINTGWRSLVT